MKKILVVFGNDDFINRVNCDLFDAIVLGHENHQLAQNRVAQMLFGAISATCKTKIKLNKYRKNRY